MSSGFKEMVINTQERAISPDINRAQSFKGKDIAELFRFMLDAYADDDRDAGAVLVEPNTSETPLRAEIINGLMVKPQPASSDLLVSAGVAMLMAPDAAPDESNYKYIDDVGVTAGGILQIGANASGSIRIDVVECRKNPVDLIITDNRDIFNGTTGLFTPANVTKERSGRLDYRVRAGTPGAGYPGNAAGWLPLCVASVPDGSANVDTVTFWDVRPLLNDRIHAPFALTKHAPFPMQRKINGTVLGGVTGITDIELNGRRVGGRLRSGSVVADAESIDVSAVSNRALADTFAANALWHLYLLTPFGLPRWARYTASGTRQPRSPRGIPVVSTSIAPDPDGRPSDVIPMPAITGLVGTASKTQGVCIASAMTDGGAAQTKFFVDDHSGLMLSNTVDIAPAVVGGVGPTNGTIDWVLNSGVDFPADAKALLLEFRYSYAPTVATTEPRQFKNQVTMYVPNTSTVFSTRAHHQYVSSMDTNIAYAFSFQCWVPMASLYPSTAVYAQRVQFIVSDNAGLTPGAASAQTLRIIGWRY